MAPSRGLQCFQRLVPATGHHFYNCTKSFSTTATRSHNFVELSTNPSSKHQVYISRSLDPYLNLSIEHFLLQKTPADSTILFLYTNASCIVIGRNQNPWVEVNLRLLRTGDPEIGLQNVQLVRRRSGGGTVFHDSGNVNYSVICPSAVFDRDKHAKMVVRALRDLGIDRARVNERHDIVLDQGRGQPSRQHQSSESEDIDRTIYTPDDTPSDLQPLKVSGSAYKLTRLRSLHHGTCLLSSPNLHLIPHYLHSPAKAYIRARGVDSVSSPVGNVGLSNESFLNAVVHHFARMYDFQNQIPDSFLQNSEANAKLIETNGCVFGLLDETLVEVPEIRQGVEELQSLEWTYQQTPQFTFASHPEGAHNGEVSRPPLPTELPSSTQVTFTARAGQVTESHISVSNNSSDADREAEQLQKILKGRKIHEIQDWSTLLKQASTLSSSHANNIGRWIGSLLGR